MRDNSQKVKGGQYRRMEWDSLAELASYCDDADTPHPWEMDSSDRSESGESWAGSKNLAQCIEWARNGQWICPELEELTSAYDHGSMGDVPVLSFEPDVVGVRVNMPAVMAGTPDCMFQIVETPVQRRIVRLLVGKTYSAAVPPEVIVDVSKAILAWISSVELHSQVSVEIVLSTNCQLRGLHLDALVTVKRAGAPLDMSEVAFALCNPGYFRRLMFRVFEAQKRDTQCYGYGTVTKAHKEVLDDCDLFLPNICCSSSSEAWRLARQFRQQLNAFIETEVVGGAE